MGVILEFCIFSKHQLKFGRLLFKYLCHTRGHLEGKIAFQKHLHVLGNLREMSDIMKNKTIKIMPLPSLEEEIVDLKP